MKRILLSIVALSSMLYADAQGYYYFKDSTGTNPGNVNTEQTEYPVGGGIASGWTTVLGGGNTTPAVSPSQTIPFAFSFNGGTVTTYRAMSNGTVSFASNPSAPASYGAISLPSASNADSSINIMDIRGIGSNDNIVSKTFGTAPNRQHWIFFTSYTPASGTGWIYWSIVLEETTNNIYVVDQRSNNVVSGMTVGIQINSTTAITATGHSTLSSNDPTPADNRYYEFLPGTQPTYDMAAKSSSVDDIVVLGNAPFTIAGTIQNRGTATVTSYDLNYKVGSAATVTSPISGVSIANGATTTFSHPTTWTPASAGTYTIEAWATNINGNPDANTADDKISFVVDVVDTILPRKTLLEVFTASTCPPCTPGNIQMDSVVLPTIDADKYTVIKYQQNFPGAGDPYATATSVNRRGFYAVNSIPRMEIDGEWDVNANSFTKPIFESYNAEPSFVDIKITNARYAGPIVRVEAEITPYANLSGNLRYHVVVSEKYTTGNVGTNGETHFNNVMMDMIPTENGNALTSLTSGTTTSVNLLSDMSSSNVEEFMDLKAVVFVQDMTTKKILQSEWMDISPSPTSIDENELSATLNIFPNPSNGFVNLEYISGRQGAVSISVISTLGATVYASNGVSNGSMNKTIDLSNLTKGIYFVTVSSDNVTTTKKLIIQ